MKKRTCLNKSMNTRKSLSNLRFASAKVRRIKNISPLYRAYYRGYNRGYIGGVRLDYQAVTLVGKNGIYFLMSRRRGSCLYHIPFLLGQITYLPQLLKVLPFVL